MEAIVAGHGDQGTPCRTDGVEDLHRCLSPHPHVEQLVPLGDEIELDAVPRPRQGTAADQKRQ